MVQLSINANNTIRQRVINKPNFLGFFIWPPPLGGADVLHSDVDALPLTQVLPAMLFCEDLDRDEAFFEVHAWIVAERLDPNLVVMFEQCLFHRSTLP